MEELLASQPQKLIILHRGQEVEGTVVSISDKEITLDLGAKSESVIATREISEPQIKELKVGSKIKAYVYIPENEHGQIVLSFERQTPGAYFEGTLSRGRSAYPQRGFHSRGGKSIDWSKFLQAQNQKSKLRGSVLEVNKGGLIVSVKDRSASGGEVRGFLPNSQVGFGLLSKSGEGMESLIGQDLTVTVIEVDQNNNKLIFSERGQISPEVKKKLKGFENGQKVQGKIVAILPFGLVVDVAGLEGLVFISDVSWEKVEDLSKDFKIGQEIEVVVLGLDEELGRLNLSIKQLTEDPFVRLAENYPADEVVKGTVTAVSEAGAVVKLEVPGEPEKAGLEGFLPSSKMNPDTTYEVGKPVTVLVDSVDLPRRRINLAPFVTSTAGLIYK